MAQANVDGYSLKKGNLNSRKLPEKTKTSESEKSTLSLRCQEAFNKLLKEIQINVAAALDSALENASFSKFESQQAQTLQKKAPPKSLIKNFA